MARPLRIEYPGAVYHITSRGNVRQDMFLDDGDRQSLPHFLENTGAQYDRPCHAYCLMANHYHLLPETPDLVLSVRQLNGVYARRSNYGHGRSGCTLKEIAARLAIRHTTASRIVRGQKVGKFRWLFRQ